MGGWFGSLVALVGLGADAVGLAKAIAPRLPRFGLRAQRRLRPIRDIENGRSWSEVPRRRFGFASPTDLELNPTTDFAEKVTAYRTGPKPFFEIHKLDDGSYQVVAYASEAHASYLEQDDPSRSTTASLDLFSRRWSQAPELVSIPWHRIHLGEYHEHRRGGMRLVLSSPQAGVVEAAGNVMNEPERVLTPVSEEERQALFHLRTRIGEMHETILSHHHPLDEATLEYVLVRMRELRAAGGRYGHHEGLQETIRTLENRDGWLLRYLRLDQGRQVNFRSAEEEREARREADDAYRVFVSACNDLLMRGQPVGTSQPLTSPRLSSSVDTLDAPRFRPGTTENEASLEVEIDDSMFSTRLDYRQRTTRKSDGTLVDSFSVLFEASFRIINHSRMPRQLRLPRPEDATAVVGEFGNQVEVEWIDYTLSLDGETQSTTVSLPFGESSKLALHFETCFMETIPEWVENVNVLKVRLRLVGVPSRVLDVTPFNRFKFGPPARRPDSRETSED